MAFEVVFRERLPQEVLDELDQHNATLSGYLDEEHKEDGSHGDVTADSVVVANDVTAGGDVTAEGNATFNGEGPHTFGAIQLRPNLSNTLAPSYETVKLGDHWAVAVGDHLAGTSKGLNFFDLTRSAVDPVLTLYYHTVNGEYVFMPRPTIALAGGVALGNPTGFNESYNHVVTRSGYYERGRMVPMGQWQDYTPSWTSSGTQPTLGNGTLTGQYTLIGDTCHFNITLTFGSTTSFGTGTHRLSLPQAVHSSFTNTMHKAFMFDADGSPTRHEGIGILDASSTAVLMATASADSITSVRLMTSTTPFTWATGDFYKVCGFYRIA